MTYARLPLHEATLILTDELDRIIGRVTRHDSHLRMERESDKHWIVGDVANGDVVMMRASVEVCGRFVRAFAGKHPEATVDWESVREADVQARGGGGNGGSSEASGSRPPGHDREESARLVIGGSRDTADPTSVPSTEQHSVKVPPPRLTVVEA